jgi:hypothetical protein
MGCASGIFYHQRVDAVAMDHLCTYYQRGGRILQGKRFPY